MGFQSLHFFVFMLGVFVLNHLLRSHLGMRKNVLLLASYYFYMTWDVAFAGLIALMTVVNFMAGRGIARSRTITGKRLWLAVALSVCLAVLAYFKYVNFFLDSAVSLLRAVGLFVDVPTLQVVLPIGISFFTFQSLSYTIDVYRGQQTQCRSFRDFALFVSFFPTILSGPITRSRQLLPQFEQPLPADDRRYVDGLYLTVRGFIKKILFADILATHIVNPAFSSPEQLSGGFLLLAVYAYSFQIYMDLSGYTDIARGSAKLLGFELPRNFDYPYRAVSVSNFWQRWHISMSSFFRDYLYFGVGGSKRGNVYLNLLITFVAIGLWHGAGWNFIVYGLVHGSIVGFERWRRTSRSGIASDRTGWRLAASVLVTFQIVAFSRVLFRAEDLQSAVSYLGHLLSATGGVFPLSLLAATSLTLAVILHYLPGRWIWEARDHLVRLPAVVQAMMIGSLCYTLVVFSGGEAPFVYFQF